MKIIRLTSSSAILNRCLLGTILLAAGLALPARTEAQDQRRIALVVGNDDYQHATKLSNAVNDSRSVAKALRHVGFDVIHVENASIDQFDEALSKFLANGRKADVGLFYFAGHGIEFDEQNFLLPVDASPENHAQLKRQAMSLEDVLEGLKNVNLSAKMAVLDCCRDNPLASRSFMATRSNSGGLKGYADGTLPEATMIMYAAAPGKVALDGANGNSPFTEAFVRNIEKRDQTMYEAFLNTSDEVVDATSGRQEPWLNAHGAGRTFRGMAFAIPGSVDASTLAAAAPAPAAPQVQAPAGFPAQMPVQATAPAIQPAAAVGPYLSNAPGSAPTLPSSVMSAIMQGNGQFPATLAPAVSAPVATTPLEPIPMPERGYFTNDEVFQQGPYQEYNSWSRREILKAAQKKMEVGADGKMGKGTQAAIAAYQLGNNLTPSGLLDAPTIAALDLGGIEQTAASSSSGGSSRKYSSSGSRKSSGRSGSYRRGGGGGDQLLKAAAGAAIIYGIYRAAR